MIESIIENLKSEVGGQLTSKTELSSRKLDSVFSVIGDVVKNEAAKEMMSGNLSGLMNLFSDEPNEASANQLQSNMNSGIVSELMGKLGISPELAKNISAIVLPILMNMISKKKNDSSEDDSSFLSELLGSAGGKEGLGGLAKDMLGGFLK